VKPSLERAIEDTFFLASTCDRINSLLSSGV
jgi:hypothetical protein